MGNPLAYEIEYPYKAVDQKCDTSVKGTAGVKTVHPVTPRELD